MKKLNLKGMKGLKGIKGKKLVICVGAGAAAAAIVAGVIFGARGKKTTVDVYPFSMVGMTEYWGDNQESYGPVTTDKIQTVFLSDTQIITGIPVAAGAHVKKGDVLMTYDTTLSELQLERKRLDVEKAKLQVTEAEEELRRIMQLKPMEIPNSNQKPDYGEKITLPYDICTGASFDGSAPEKALVCWLRSDTPVNNSILRALYYQAIDNQTNAGGTGASSASAIPGSLPEATQPTQETEAATVPTEETEATTAPTEETLPPETRNPMEETTQPTQPEETAPRQPVIYSPHLLRSGDTLTVNKGRAVNLTFINRNRDDTTWSLYPAANAELVGKPGGKGFVVYGFPETVGETEYTVKAAVHDADSASFTFRLKVVEPEESQKEVNDFYIVLKKTEDDRKKAPTVLWQGVHVSVYNGNDYGFTLFDAPGEDAFFPSGSSDGDSGVDIGSGMTAAELSQLRREQQKKVMDLYETAQMTESEYKLMEREFNDGNVRAEMDGEVVSLLSEEEARDNKQPLIKVSDGGGFYVEGSVSELEKDNLEIGQEVTVNDWNTGNTYTGQVVSIGDFPTESNGWNGMGNPNASYYPFRVFIDGSADLQAGNYVSVTYSAAQAQAGIYLENPFLRTDEAEPYVYVRNAHNRLEKRTVTTGKSLWGSYTEIRSGLSADDYVAFPYGKTVKDGAPTQEGDYNALYGY